MAEPREIDPRQPSWELGKALHLACAPLAFNYTVPIFRETEDKGRLKASHFGSGILVRVDGKPILITAGHVLDEVVSSSDVFGLSTMEPGTKGVRLVPDRPPATNIPPGTKRPEDDFIDVGAFRLREAEAKLLGDRFLPEYMIEANDNELNGYQYLLLGYPGSSARRKFYNRTAMAKAYTYVTSLYRLGRGTPDDYDPEAEVLVDYSKKKTVSGDFVRITASKPHGMSGCGIWRMYSSDPPSETWDAGTMRLVGITHTYCPKLNIIRGTRIGLVLEMIKQILL